MSDPPKRKSRTRRYARRAWVWGLEAIALVMLLVLSGGGLAAWRLSQGPIDLSFAKPQIEAALTEARGAPVRIGSLVLEWSPDRRRVELAARALAFDQLDQQGTLTPDAIRVDVETWPLLVGRVEARRIAVEGGQVYATRLASGVWRFGLGEWQPEFADQTLQAGTFSLNDLQNLFDVAFGARLTDVSIAGAVLSVRPTEESLPERVDVEMLRLVRDDDRLRLAGDFRVKDPEGTALPTEAGFHVATVRVDAPQSLDTALVEITAPGLPVSRLGLYEPGLVGRLPDGRSDVLATLQISAAFGLERFDLAVSNTRLVAGPADAETAFALGDVTVLDGELSVDFLNRRAGIERLVIASDRLELEGTAETENIDLLWSGPGAVDVPDGPERWVEIRVNLPRYEVDLTPVFEAPWQGADVVLEARYAPSRRVLELDRLALNAAGAGLTGRGMVRWSMDQAGLLPFGVTLTADARGRVLVSEVVRYWPVDMAASARSWVIENVTRGFSQGGQIRLDVPPEAFARGQLRDEEMVLDFAFADATVRVIDDLPAIVGASGTGSLRGNSLALQMRTGRMGQWSLSDASMTVPYLFPSGAIGVIEASASGPVGNLIRMLDESSLQIAKRYGLEYANIEGIGQIDMRFLRPMKPTVEIEGIGMLFDGSFTDVRLPDVAGGLDLTAKSAAFLLQDQDMRLSGEGQFGPVPLTFAWSERLEEGGMAQLDASLDVTPDLLNRLGYRVRQFLSGKGSVKLIATGQDGALNRFESRIDLAGMGIDLDEIGFRKPVGVPAEAVVVVAAATPPDGQIYDLEFRGAGLNADASVLTLSAGGVRSITLERFVLDDRADVRGEVVRSGEGFAAVLNGTRLDLSPLFSALFRGGGEAERPAEAEVRSRAPLVPFPITLSARLEQVRIGKTQTLSDASISMDARPDGLAAAEIEGRLPKDGVFRLDLSPPDAGGAQRISLVSDDAGFVLSPVFGSDAVRAGKLSAEGQISARQQGGYRGQITLGLDEVTLVRAPVLAQVLSLASFEGLANVLSGGGVEFTRLDVPMSLDGGKLTVRDARANGPALGITLNGVIDLDDRSLDVDGVLVPSYGINSALGNIPVLGDILVGRQGEGVFGFTYSIRGEFAAALVAVNPLSAVAPGILRRIFEPSRALPPETEPVKPAE